ncbi:unnamed protein product [Heterobilharzia americana]|nr:unnamed protein product [Heterobilharzia americana]
MNGYLPPNPLTKNKGGAWKRKTNTDVFASLSSQLLEDRNSKPAEPSIHRRYSLSDISPSSDSLCLTLTKEILLKCGGVEDPSCLFEVDVTRLGLEGVDDDLSSSFSSLKKIVAADNTLSLELFKHFNNLIELDLSLNQVSCVPPCPKGFQCLQSLNLSYNFLQPVDIEHLGYLPSLRILYLCGNDLLRLPLDLAESGSASDGNIVFKFAKLEVLHLDDNKLSDVQDFVSLATLPKLQYLNLANNKFRTVPLIKSISMRKHTIIDSIGQEFPYTPNPNPQMNNLLISDNQGNQNNEILDVRGKNIKTMCSVKSDPINSPKDTLKIEQDSTNLKHKIMSNEKPECLNQHHLPRKIESKGKQHSDNFIFLDEYRNPSAPRVCIVDECIGLNNLNKLLPFTQQRRIKFKQMTRKRSTHMKSDLHVNFPMKKSNLRNNEKVSSLNQYARIEREYTLSSDQLRSNITLNNVPPPFPSLQCIDLSHNKISFEEHLLPVAVWPKLKEVIVYNNPVVNKSSQIPPLLERLLVKQLNIKVKNDISTGNNESLKNYSVKLPLTLYHENARDYQITPVSSIEVFNPRLQERNRSTLLRSKQRLPFYSNVKPIIVRHKLDESSLNEGPKMIKCNVDQILNELTTIVDHKTSISRSESSTNKSLQTINVSSSYYLPTNNKLLPNIPYKISQLHPIQNCKTFIKMKSQCEDNFDKVLSDLQCKDEGDEKQIENDVFFTTQLSSLDPDTKQTSKSDPFDQLNYPSSSQMNQQNSYEYGSSEKMLKLIRTTDEYDEEQDDKALIEYSPTHGPLLPDLEWIVDEDNLPDSMQACLRELRYLLQHKPTIHSTSQENIIQSPLLMLTEDRKPIQYSTEEPSSLAVTVGNEITKSIDRNSLENLSEQILPISPVPSVKLSSKSMELVPVNKTSKILPLKTNLQQLSKKYTNFIEIPLTKALNDEEREKRKLDNIRAKQNPVVKSRKWNYLKFNNNQSKQTVPKGAKELFEQFQEIYSNVRVEAIQRAMNTVKMDFDKKTQQLC